MKRAGVAWLVIGGFITAYDYWACKTDNETLTQAFHRSLTHPASRPLVVIGSGIVIKHLGAPRFYPHLDPIQRLADKWRTATIVLLPESADA